MAADPGTPKACVGVVNGVTVACIECGTVAVECRRFEIIFS
jgi:hypothetical protein